MEYTLDLEDSAMLDKLLRDDDLYLNEPDYSGPEYNDIGDLDDADFDKFVVNQLESQQFLGWVNG
jgi:hypothetical protein|tara:strand:+ start:3754 stop:3948 length:195 start_codon:yes stop_codon:yes gene_type:complete